MSAIQGDKTMNISELFNKLVKDINDLEGAPTRQWFQDRATIIALLIFWSLVRTLKDHWGQE
jgi:hypothetical protein